MRNRFAQRRCRVGRTGAYTGDEVGRVVACMQAVTHGAATGVCLCVGVVVVSVENRCWQ